MILVDLIRVKMCLTSFFYELPWCCNCMCLWEHECLWKHSNNWGSVSESTIIIWRGLFPGGWLITATANHSNYLVCDRANTQSVTVRKVVKLQLSYCNALVIKWIYSIVLFGGKNAGDVHSSSLLIDVYALLFSVSLRRQASMTQAENFRTLFAQNWC